MKTRLRKIKHRLEYSGVQALIWLAGRMSLPAAQRWGRALGTLAFHLVRIRRRVTEENLARAFPEKSRREIRRLAAATYRQFGMMLMETVRLLCMTPEEVMAAIEVDDRTPFDRARAAGRGAVLLTAHMGNWEYLGVWISNQGYPASYIFQEQANPYVDELIRRFRSRMGMDVIPRGKALRGFLQALRRGHFVAAVADQDAGKNGIFIDFMGNPASTTAGPAKFVLKTGAEIIFGVAYRDANHRLHAHIETLDVDVSGLDEEQAVRAIMEKYTRTLEKWIRRYPDQWFWMHRRWKTPPTPRKKEPCRPQMSEIS